MTRQEYELIQERLSKKLKSRYPTNKEEAYNNGILAAKSIIKEFFEYHNTEDKNNGS